MKNTYQINKIGTVNSERGMFSIQVDKEFISGLTSIEGFQYLQIVWWGHLSDTTEKRSLLVYDKPYKKGPGKLGVFATRSEARPNPLLVTTIQVVALDLEAGKIFTPYIDAEIGSQVLDIKPYHRVERIRDCDVPNWCDHWPKYYEDAGTFDWANEFNF